MIKHLKIASFFETQGRLIIWELLTSSKIIKYFIYKFLTFISFFIFKLFEVSKQDYYVELQDWWFLKLNFFLFQL